MPAEGVVSGHPAGVGDGVPQFGGAMGVQSGRGTSDVLSVPPKHSVSNVLGFIKGKIAIQIARVYAGRRRNFVGQHFLALGYWVSTVGKNEAAMRQYMSG